MDVDEVLVENEITHQMVPIRKFIYDVHQTYELASLNFEYYAKFLHDTTSTSSADVYMALMAKMDAAKRNFRLVENSWCIAKKGYSLN